MEHRAKEAKDKKMEKRFKWDRCLKAKKEDSRKPQGCFGQKINLSSKKEKNPTILGLFSASTFQGDNPQQSKVFQSILTAMVPGTKWDTF